MHSVRPCGGAYWLMLPSRCWKGQTSLILSTLRGCLSQLLLTNARANGANDPNLTWTRLKMSPAITIDACVMYVAYQRGRASTEGTPPGDQTRYSLVGELVDLENKRELLRWQWSCQSHFRHSMGNSRHVDHRSYQGYANLRPSPSRIFERQRRFMTGNRFTAKSSTSLNRLGRGFPPSPLL